jgi:RNA polymerase sigma-70 factor (ECF subfamily)
MAAADPVAEKPISDDELIEQICGNDLAAFDLLYERYFPRVYGYVKRRLSNPADAEETVQEIFINVFSCLDSFRGDAPFAAWVLGVSRRTVASRFKKKQHPMVSLEDSEDESPDARLAAALRGEPTPLEHYECTERVARMEAAAREQLSEDQWRLFSLHHLQHLSVREIARFLDRSEDAVKSHLYRARKLLLAR